MVVRRIGPLKAEVSESVLKIAAAEAAAEASGGKGKSPQRCSCGLEEGEVLKVADRAPSP